MRPLRRLEDDDEGLLTVMSRPVPSHHYGFAGSRAVKVSLPRLRCLEEPHIVRHPNNGRARVFVFTPPPYGPQSIGIQFPTFTPKGYEVAAAALVNPESLLADRVLEPGELLIDTADNLPMLRFIQSCGMFQRAS